MRPSFLRTFSLSIACLLVVLAAGRTPGFQAGRDRKASDKQDTQKTGDVIRLETSLVAVPVVASDRSDRYVADLTQPEFSLFEDGTKQEIVFFAEISEPFHVILMLDTSGSTKEKLSSIQRAARAFVTQLQPADRTKVMSFDETVRELSDFTSDRATLEKAIGQTTPGEGTKLYDAVDFALEKLSRIKGRKAIVLFTDGVDYRSDRATYDRNLGAVEESGVIVYPIRFETRADTEALIRRQQAQYGSATDVGLILGGPPIGTTPPTMPGGGGTSIPRPRPGASNDPYKLPGPSVILGPAERYPGDNRNPSGRYPDDRSGSRQPYPDNRFPPGGGASGGAGGGTGGRADDRFPDANDPSVRRRPADTVNVMLDGLYATADQYLGALAVASGGRLHRADTLSALPTAFAQIAAELRQQYSIGYYSTNGARDGKYRKIQVKVSRKDVVLRARPGYRAPRD